jgi:hypothetical protein
MQYSLSEAKAHLSQLMDEVAQGKEVIITRHGKPAARLERIVVKRGVLLGQMAGEFEMPPDETFAAWSDEEAEAFLEGR